VFCITAAESREVDVAERNMSIFKKCNVKIVAV